MIRANVNKAPRMAKSKNPPATPRRRASLGKCGSVSKVTTRALSRPVSGTSSSVTPSCNIRVVVRVRPPNSKEQEDNYYNAVKVVDDQMLVFDPKEEESHFFYHGVQQKTRDLLKKAKKDLTFMFDKVFGNACSNMEVFINSTQSLINTLMDGCNCSVFAYGATGAGKTFTMIGNSGNPGITYLTMKDLFKRKEELSSEREFELMVTYIEVYNELVKDLLNPGPPLNLREDAKYGVLIPGVKGHKINNPDELFSLLEQGNKRRTQHPTDANAESSRSHAVFQVYIRMTKKTNREVMQAKLSMIDLAGSERGSATGFVGARFKEGANINKSLLALGNCINSLADGHRHVPYRDSKLTRLLKDSLGGNCHTIMIANVSPSSMSFDDTYNTLKYATRAKKIKSNIKRNIVNVDLHVDQYVKLVEDLQTENSTLKSDNAKLRAEIEHLKSEGLQPVGPVEISDDSEHQAESSDDLMDQLQRENEELKKQIELAQASRTQTDFSVLETFRQMKLEKEELMHSLYHLQNSQLGMSLRRELKVGIESRLSIFYIDTPTKDKTRRKLNDQLERYEKKVQSTGIAIGDNKNKQARVDETIQTFVEMHPELKEEYKVFRLEMDCLKHRHERDLARRETEIVLDDNRANCVLIENMANLIAPLFMAVGGKDDAPEHIKKKYQDLVSAFDGKKNLRWPTEEGPSELDSGLSSLTSIPDDPDEKNRAAKRKIGADSQTALDSTFTLEDAQKKLQRAPVAGTRSGVNSEMMAKDFKNPAPKRLAKAASPKCRFPAPSRGSPLRRLTPKSKENARTAAHVIRPDTATNLAGVKKATSKGLLERPRFRM